MKLAEVTTWVEAHPTESIVIGLGGTLAVLWLLGFFSSSSSNNSGASSLAAAYYAAEAQQAVVGGQIQVANIQATAGTAQSLIGANAAVAINAAQTGAATTINGQNASAATTINQSLGSDALLATQSSNNAALAAVQSNNAAAAQITQSNNTAGLMNNFISSIMPGELATSPGGWAANIPGLGYITGATGIGAVSSPFNAAQAGYSPAAIAKLFPGMAA